MAERVLRSPGVTTRELDLSAPGRVRPQGIPAGVIGTSDKGPAFVPVNFATVNDFKSLFGESKGVHFGAMAVNEWMRYHDAVQLTTMQKVHHFNPKHLKPLRYLPLIGNLLLEHLL